jgi:DNA-binding FrmR family transcriptional regulator
MRVTEEILPLKTAVERIQGQLEAIANNGGEAPSTFT